MASREGLVGYFTYTHVRVWSYGRKFDHFDNTDSLQYLGIETRG